MPDDELMILAESGKLSEPAKLTRQVDRMLEDPKARAFTRHFPERWLKLHELGRMEPDRKGPYGHYFRVKDSLVPQVQAYFEDLLKRNGPVRELIDSDYTFVNRLLGELIYKQRVVGDNLRKVVLDDRRRGGLLTMPAVMTVTANGVDTSPIKRGVFVLENILGTPPPPPPPDVEPLSPDLRGTKTLKEQLAAHRNQEACRSCHRKIDPIGFPLENYDPIGRWRDHYPKVNRNDRQAPVVETTTTLSNGKKLNDIVELKALLLKRESQVIRCLAKKLMSYGTGRLMEAGDRGEINKIVNTLETKGNGLRDLVHLITTSALFHNK